MCCFGSVKSKEMSQTSDEISMLTSLVTTQRQTDQWPLPTSYAVLCYNAEYALAANTNDLISKRCEQANREISG
jgi:hypothetical protein